LSRLLAGQAALVDRIVGRADHVHRLEEFGLLGGTRIQMFRCGSPCIIRLAGNKVCLRADDLTHVMVKPALP
jgi:Fe2+ transport system protein FeoA